MAGLSGQLRCEGFVESSDFAKAKDQLKLGTGLTDREIDDRLEALVWALLREPAAIAEQIPGRNLWVAVTTAGAPLIRVYLRPRRGIATECELLWIEERI
jgi:hypothetical protein